MTTEPGGSAAVDNSPKSPRRIFYRQLTQLLEEGGFDRHMVALCKPFIANAAGPAWWSSQPSSYFRILFVGYLEGIESEQELCWALEDSRTFREFTGLGDMAEAVGPETLAQIRQPLLPLIHSEAFDSLIRIIEKSGLLDGRMPELDIASLLSDPAVGAVVARVRSKDHHSYWKRLTRMGGASWSTRPSVPTKTGSARSPFTKAEAPIDVEPFAMWLDDLSLAASEITELRSRGVTDFSAHFAEGPNSIVDHVIRACIYGRGPNSVRAYTSAAQKSERELPQQMTAGTLDACRSIAAQLAEGKKQVALEAPVLDAEGRPAVVAIHVTVTPQAEESLNSVLISYTDVTARRKQEVKPAAADSHIEKALSLNHIGVWEWDVVNETTYWSDAMLRIYGISREEFTGSHGDYADWTYPDDRESQRESVRQSTVDAASRVHAPVHPSAASTTFRDYRIRRKDGQIRWVRGGAVEVVDDQGRPCKMQGVLWDITESKQLELQLRESEDQHRRTVEDAPVPIVATAFDGEILFANDCALSYFEVGRDDLAKRQARDFWQDEAQRASAMSILAEKGELRGYLARLRIGSAGDPRSSLVNARVVEFAGRNVILSCHQDVTEREQLLSLQAQAVSLLEQRQRELMLLNRVLLARDQAPSAMLSTACRELGQGLACEGVLALLLQDAQDGTRLLVAAQYCSTGEPGRQGVRLPYSESSLSNLFRGQPQPVWIADAALDDRAIGIRDLLTAEPHTALLVAPLTDSGRWLGALVLELGTGQEPDEERATLACSVAEQAAHALAAHRTAEVARDDHLRRDRKARQVDRLDALAAMATGVTRTLNNALGSVLGYGELALEDVGDHPKARDYLLQLLRGAEHTQSILEQIGAIGRRAQPEPSEVAMAAMVSDVAKLCRAISPELEVVVRCADAIPNVLGDPAQLHQLLLHVGVSALKALGEPLARLEFSVDRVDVDATLALELTELEIGPYVHVGISDNGGGLSETALDRAFEPFGVAGDGSGFGLAVAYGIARAHRGTLGMMSQLGKGTRVDVYVPAISTEHVTSTGTGTDLPMGNGERVLYVDDDAASCLVTARLLERLGYNYQGFDNPDEALQWFSGNASQVDIALCDFSLPSTTGLDVALELLRQRPELPVLLTTAFAGGWNSEAMRRKHGIREIVAKPLQLRALGRALTRNLLPQELSGSESSAPE